MKQHYPVLLDTDPVEGGYAVTVPALPGCFSQGETVAEARAHTREAITVHVRSMVHHGKPVPNEGAGLIVARVEAEIGVDDAVPALA